MISGVCFVIAACMCWGLIFVIPKFLEGFNPLEIAFGRYLFFGIVSLALLLISKRHLFHKSFLLIWRRALWLGFVSTLLSYTSVVFCIRYANPAVAALIFGLSPITIPFFSNWYKREYAFRNFILPAALMLIGIFFVNLQAFSLGVDSLGRYCFGLFCGIAGLASWTWYTIANFHFMKRNPTLSSRDWTTMLGVATLFMVIFAMALYFGTQSGFSRYFHFNEELKLFLIGSSILGIIGSWVGYYFWNCGNARLPVSLAGQLTIFEMIFGILFVYIAEGRLPFRFEITGILIMLLGLLSAFRIVKRVPELPPN